MKIYYFVGWRQALDGIGVEVDLPESAGYLVLAEPYGTEYALIECELPPDILRLPGGEPVSEDLANLLDAAKQYAPALALSRNHMRRVESVSRTEFSRLLAAALRAHLSAQRQSPFFIASACKSQVGYKNAGTYYWIVGYRPDRVGHEVSWVSRDFYVYQDSIADFDVDAAYLKQRFG